MNHIITGVLKKAGADQMLNTGLINKSEYDQIGLYMKYANLSDVYYDGFRGFIIETPEIVIIHNTKEELIQDIAFNLECIKAAYNDRLTGGKH